MTKNPLFIIVLALLCFAAISTLYYKPISDDSDAPLNKGDDGIQQALYRAAMPQYGNFIKTIDLNAIFDNSNDIAMATTTAQNAKSLKIGQDIILMDKDNNILPLGGTLQTIRKNNIGADLLFTLPEETDTDLLSPLVRVIIFENNLLKLLPLTALQTDAQTNTNYLWGIRDVATDNQNANPPSIEKIEILPVYKNEKYVALNRTFSSDYLLILNPDETLNENLATGIIPKYKKVALDVPNYNPIYTAWLEYNQKKLAALSKKIKAEIEACKNKENNKTDTNNTDDTAEGCGAPSSSSTIISAEEIFANIQNLKDGGQNSGADACGNTATAGNCN